MRSLDCWKLVCLTATLLCAVVPQAVAQMNHAKTSESGLTVAPKAVAQINHAKTSEGGLSVAAKPVSAKTDQAFVILQKHYFLGRWQIFINKDKVKAVNQTDGYSIVTMAPAWKVVFYRDTGGAPKMYQSTMKEFQTMGLPISAGYVVGGKLNNANQSLVRYKGLNVIRYDMKRLDHTASKPAWTLADVPKESPVVLSHYWVSVPISSDDMICSFLQKLFMMPATRGYPVAFIDTRADLTRTAVLDILSCKGLPPADMHIEYPSPGKYQVCSSPRDVTISNAKRDSFNEWAQAIGKD